MEREVDSFASQVFLSEDDLNPVRSVNIFANNNGNLQSMIELASDAGGRSIMLLTSQRTDSTLTISKDKTVMLKSSLNDTKCSGEVLPSGEILHVIEIGDSKTKASSKIENTSVTIDEQCGVTSEVMLARSLTEVTTFKVRGDPDGKANIGVTTGSNTLTKVSPITLLVL